MSDPTLSTTATNASTNASTTASPTASPTAATTSEPAPTLSEPGQNIPAIVGGAVGGALGLVLIVVLIALLLYRRHKRRNRRQPPTLPHPDDIRPTLFTESTDAAHGRNSDDVTNDHDDDDDDDDKKGKTNIVFIDSDDDLPQPQTGFQNNNKPHHTPDNNNTSLHSSTPRNNTPRNNTPRNNTPRNNTPRNNTPYHPPKTPLVPKSNSESVINIYRDQPTKDQGMGSFPRQRGGSLKPPDEDYIQMGGNSPILGRTLSPPTACKPMPGHGYINVLNHDKSTSSDSEPDLDQNSDLYENFTAETTHCDTDEDRSAGQEKTPKYINVDKLVPQLTPPQKPDGRWCDDDTSEDEEQVNYINMENPSLLSPTSELFAEKLNESLREAGRSAEQPSYPPAPRQGHPPTATAKPKPDKSKGKSLNHNRENEHSAETGTPVLFKPGKSNSDISTLSNSDFPKQAKNWPALKRVLRKASDEDNDQLEKQMELDSMADAQNSDHDDVYENSAEFFHLSPQVLESSSVGAGQSAPGNIRSDRPRTPAQGANANTNDRPRTPAQGANDSTSDRPRTPAQGAQKSRKPPAVLPKSVAKNNQGTSDISQLKSRLKKTNTGYNESVENKQQTS